tara:strand:+ start:410 stop:1678 length:1269 start_codon:yes stop_codon:yes gene_type:complete
MVNFIEKYKPKNSLEYIGHFKFINDFKCRLNQDNFKKIIICIGYSGVGKTSMLKKIFNELNYTYKEFINSETFKEEINNYINFKTIDSFFKKTKKLIFIDDLEVLSNDKNFINYLLKIDNKNIPIVCVINKIYSRKFNDLRKKSEIFYISKPPLDKCYKYITHICNNENYELDKTKLENIKIFIKDTNFNIKNILLNLHNLLNNNSKNIIDYKEVDIDLYDNINYIIKNKYSIEDLEKIISSDVTLISMLLHENIFTIFNKKKMKEINLNPINIINIYEDILEDICLSDKIEHYIFENTNWNSYIIMSIIRVYKLNYYYSLLKNNEFNKINFTQILTKYSLRYNFNKKKFMILDDYNLSSNYFDFIIQRILLSITDENTEEDNTHNKIIEKYRDKEYNDILKKYNKEYNIINNDFFNKLKIK